MVQELGLEEQKISSLDQDKPPEHDNTFQGLLLGLEDSNASIKNDDSSLGSEFLDK